MHGQQMADMRRSNLSASAAAMNVFIPLKYSSQRWFSRYIHLLSAICIVKQENYQYPSKMNTSHDNIEILITALKDIQKHEQLN